MICTAIIILNYNNYKDTINCILSVEKYNTTPVKYIVIDNGSTLREAVNELNNWMEERFNKSYRKFIFEDNPKPMSLSLMNFIVSCSNDGYAQGNNKGLKYAYADSQITDVLILNNDILFVEDTLRKLITIRQSLTDVAIISPLLYKRNMVDIDYNCARLCPKNWDIIMKYLLWHQDILHFISHSRDKTYLLKLGECKKTYLIEIELPSGSCMLIDKQLMEDIGGFDPNTFLYYEENILCKKIKKRKLKNYLLMQSKCIHLGASSTSKRKSFFILNAGLNSASYYLTNYANMSCFQSFIWKIAYRWFKVKLLLIKLFK